VNLAWQRLRLEDAEVYELPLGTGFIDGRRGRWLITVGPALMVNGTDYQEVREVVAQLKNRFAAGETVVYDPVLGFDAPFVPDGVLIKATAVMAADSMADPGVEVVARRRGHMVGQQVSVTPCT